MALPFFYSESLSGAADVHTLDEATSRHVAQVLRMETGEEIHLTNGKGDLLHAKITDNNKKRVEVKVLNTENHAAGNKLSIAISPVKNTSRFEWFLEKAVEIGVTDIIPLICSRSEKKQFKEERLETILISAMLQSQQTWLPELHKPMKFNELVKSYNGNQKFIAHCAEEIKQPLQLLQPFISPLILIGPEGDFTTDEITIAIENNFVPVSLGKTRLRTETAGIVAATILNF